MNYSKTDPRRAHAQAITYPFSRPLRFVFAWNNGALRYVWQARWIVATILSGDVKGTIIKNLPFGILRFMMPARREQGS
jgi:hypothetical protein